MNRKSTYPYFLVIWLVSLVAFPFLISTSSVFADDPLELDGEFTSTTPLFADNLGVIHFRFPTVMVIEEETEVLKFGYYPDPESNSQFGAVTIASALNIENLAEENEIFTAYLQGSIIFDNFVTSFAEDLQNGQRVFISQAELQIESYRVVELVTVTNQKSSFFVINTPTPLIFVANSFDHYSDMMRNTTFNMIASLEVDFEVMAQPRDLSPLFDIGQPISLVPGIISQETLNPDNRMLTHTIEGQAGDIFYIEARLLDTPLINSVILADADGHRIKQIEGNRWGFHGGDMSFSYTEIVAALEFPADGKYILLFGVVGNERLSNEPQGGEFSIVYQKVQPLPFTGESPSEYVHAFMVEDGSALSYLTVDHGLAFNERHITEDIYSFTHEEFYNLRDNTISKSGTSGNSILFETTSGPILFIVKDNLDLRELLLPNPEDQASNTETITLTVDAN